MKTHNHDLPKPGDRGRVRPFVGKLPNGKRAKFTVGNDQVSPAEMRRRLAVIRSLYEHQCERWNCDYWKEWTRQVALKIAAGRQVVDTCIGDNPRHMAGVVAQLRAWGIPVEITAPDQFQQGMQIHRDEIVGIVQNVLAEQLAQIEGTRGAVADAIKLPDDPIALTETTTLHQALDAYAAHIRERGRTDGNGNLIASIQKDRRMLGYIKHRQENLPLWRLDLPAIDKLVAYWRNRPATMRSERASKSYAADMIKLLWRFFGWLDNHPNYTWTKPRGFDGISRKVASLPKDSHNGTFQTTYKRTYTPEQLAVIAKHTDDFGRALIGVCVNCAFGASEVGQWPTANYSFHTPHPQADKLSIGTSRADSWITGRRPKSNVYGEHLLWPQVAEVIKPFVTDGRPVLPMTRTGKPWYRTHANNTQTAFYNWWQRLITRVQTAMPDTPFPYLPFGSLRDTLPDMLRAKYPHGDKLAEIALQHGKPSDGDDLLKCYTNTPFGQLFEATRDLEAEFTPFLEAIADNGA